VFIGNLVVVLDFLILQDKHNIHTLSLNIKFALPAKQTRTARQRLTFLPVFKVRTNKCYIFQQFILYIKFIFRLLLVFIGKKVGLLHSQIGHVESRAMDSLICVLNLEMDNGTSRLVLEVWDMSVK